MKTRWLILGLAILGFADATYLTLNHYLNASTICFELTKCDLVLQSNYATVLGIPVALFGVLYYSAIVFLVWKVGASTDSGWLSYLRVLIAIGLLVSLGLVYIQLLILRAICLYCMFSALITFLIFLLAFFGFRGKRDIKPLES